MPNDPSPDLPGDAPVGQCTEPAPDSVRTQRCKVVIAYRGTNYHGWQCQTPAPNWKGDSPPEGEGLPTIQETVTHILREILGHPLHLVGSSRTDAGVHAKGQVAHFDTHQVHVPPEGLRRAVNHRLPSDILIRSIEPVPDTFHAISSTLSKRYQYLIWNARDRPLFFPDLAWHRYQNLDIAAMSRAAAILVGEHDFASFAKPGHGRTTTIRTIHDCSVHFRAPRLIISVQGAGFLWNMVRIIVGTLVQVGLGKYTPEDVANMLQTRDRTTGGPTAPARGLFLQWIKYR